MASREDCLKGSALLVKQASECLRLFKIVKDPEFIDFCLFLKQPKTRFELPSRNKHRDQTMKVAECVM